ncbi:MAG: metallophosphoesterase [Ignavibacteriaceae bacterium]|jgi:serine/threonine protein phosphatase 1|nr:metallophosphoesterase [Ignavibacteriaceae bacterium]
MVAVIGDIHGCYYTLVELYKKIVKKYPRIMVVTVGDMVDRGNHSRDVINFIIENNIKFTPGNHDYMFYHFFKEPSSVFARSWLFNGSESTLESYEHYENDIFAHIDLISKAPLYMDLDDCFISHAGVSKTYRKFLPNDYKDNLSVLEPMIIDDLKSDKGILWNRDSLLDLGKLQVVGHTKQSQITVVEESNSWYIDTGACVGNNLSAIIVHKNQFIESLEEKTQIKDII